MRRAISTASSPVTPSLAGRASRSRSRTVTSASARSPSACATGCAAMAALILGFEWPSAATPKPPEQVEVFAPVLVADAAALRAGPDHLPFAPRRSCERCSRRSSGSPAAGASSTRAIAAVRHVDPQAVALRRRARRRASPARRAASGTRTPRGPVRDARPGPARAATRRASRSRRTSRRRAASRARRRSCRAPPGSPGKAISWRLEVDALAQADVRPQIGERADIAEGALETGLQDDADVVVAAAAQLPVDLAASASCVVDSSMSMRTKLPLSAACSTTASAFSRQRSRSIVSPSAVELDADVGVEPVPLDRIEDAVVLVDEGARLLGLVDVLAEDVDRGHLPLRVQLGDDAARVLERRPGDVAVRDLADDRLRNRRQQPDDGAIDDVRRSSSRA